MSKPKCVLTVDVEAMNMRAPSDHVNTLIYGRKYGKEYGIGKIMDIADKHDVKIIFFVDFAECELYGDEIIDVGKYIISRGHDMQVHNHCEMLERVVGKKSIVNMTDNYCFWPHNIDDSKAMVDYLTEKYRLCCEKEPIAYRGGAYRFGAEILSVLKDYGYKVDFSYNYLRPEILPINRQFKFENAIIEIPLGNLPTEAVLNGTANRNIYKKPLNFNYSLLMPKFEDEFEEKAEYFIDLFESYYNYYGQDAIASMIMHSWSFMIDPCVPLSPKQFFDTPSDILVLFFDYLLSKLKDKIDFIDLNNVIELSEQTITKTVDFNAIFLKDSSFGANNLIKIVSFIKEKVGDRRVIIWGKGWMESTIFQTVNYHKELNTAFYISNDADRIPTWRGKPVHKFSDVKLNPETDYIFVVAQSTYTEIRESLKGLGFREYEDYFDIQNKVPYTKIDEKKIKISLICPFCGSDEFLTYNSEKARLCSKCHSLERTRTLLKLINDNLNVDFAKQKILHISPSIPERQLFKNLDATTTTVDIRPECKVDIVADICNMPQIANDCFDIVLASCVLNHVYDDEKALEEICRVLRPGGMALIWVLDSGTFRTVVFEDPTGWYGKENYEKYKIGTFRHYGELDFTTQLKKHFPDVRCFEKYDEITDSANKWYVCKK